MNDLWKHILYPHNRVSKGVLRQNAKAQGYAMYAFNGWIYSTSDNARLPILCDDEGLSVEL